jgi:transposase
LVAELRLLCCDEVALIQERTALINQLQSALREYYPAALEAFEDWTLPSAWAFKWEKFLHTERLARPQTYEKRTEIFAHATGFVSGQALTRAKSRLALARARMLRVLQSQIDSYRAEIEKLFAQHPDHDLFGSLPGAGPKIAPRLLGEIGSDRSRFEDPTALQCLAGTAPVSYQSGKIHKVYLRRHCNKLLRQAVHLWANLSGNPVRGLPSTTSSCAHAARTTPALYAASVNVG